MSPQAALPLLVFQHLSAVINGYTFHLRNQVLSDSFKLCGLLFISGLLCGIGVIFKGAMSPSEHDFPVWAALGM